MLRTLSTLLLGVLVGAGAALFARDWTAPSTPQDAPAVPEAVAPVPPTADQALSEQRNDEPSDFPRANPAAALTQLGSLRGLARADAIESFAREHAPRDPASALDLVARLRGSDARELRDALLEQWALVDPEALMTYVGSIGSTREQRTLLGEFPRWTRTLAASAPERVLEWARSLPNDLGVDVQQLAIGALAETKLARAADIAAGMADRMLRDSYAIAIGSAVGAHDPDFALAWLESMEAPHWNAVSNVLEGISKTDFARAVDVVLTPPWSERAEMISLDLTASRPALSSAEARMLAERIAAAADKPIAPRLMRQVVVAWAARDINAALTWVLANEHRFASAQPSSPATTLGGRSSNPSRGWDLVTAIAGQAGLDVDAAMSVVMTLPPDRRREWVQRVSVNTAFRDPEKALSLLEPYRGESFFESTYSNMLRTVAISHPPARVAALFDRMSEQMREELAGIVAERWTEVDSQAARRWVESLSRGATRDRALTGALQGMARSGAFDASLLAQFSSSEAMQRNLLQVVFALTQTRPELARRVVAEHIGDETLRARALTFIEQAETIGR